MRTADDVIKDWQTQCQQYPGIELLADNEIMLAEVLRLRDENAEMRGELGIWITCLAVRQAPASIMSPDGEGWISSPYTTWSAMIRLAELGIVEKHPDREAYRFVQEGGDDETGH